MKYILGLEKKKTNLVVSRYEIDTVFSHESITELCIVYEYRELNIRAIIRVTRRIFYTVVIT